MKEYKIRFTGNGWVELNTTALFDPNIGLTILAPDGGYIFCWHGPLSPVGKRLELIPGEKIWIDAMLQWRIGIFEEMLESGYFNLDEYQHHKQTLYGRSRPTQIATCPFIGE